MLLYLFCLKWVLLMWWCTRQSAYESRIFSTAHGYRHIISKETYDKNIKTDLRQTCQKRPIFVRRNLCASLRFSARHTGTDKYIKRDLRQKYQNRSINVQRNLHARGPADVVVHPSISVRVSDFQRGPWVQTNISKETYDKHVKRDLYLCKETCV